jgi:hypothetical protein
MLLLPLLALAQDPAPIRFCTSSGPVEITVAGGRVSGAYFIVFNGDRGRLEGTWERGRFEGRWIEEGKPGGPTALFFDDGLKHFWGAYRQDANDRWWGWSGHRADLPAQANHFCTEDRVGGG